MESCRLLMAKGKIRYCVLYVRKEVLFLIVCYKLIFNEQQKKVYIYTHLYHWGLVSPTVKKKIQRKTQKIS